MEWRIILPVLCLIVKAPEIALTQATGAATQTTATANQTTATANQTTATANQTMANATQTTANANQTTATANQTTATANLTTATANLTTATANLTTATANQTTTTATATTLVPSKLATIQVVFRIIQEYKDIYSDLTNPVTTELTKNITNAFTPFYKKRFPNFFRMRIQKYSAGSIVADSAIDFDTTNNTSSPNVIEVTQVFNDAITNGNLSFKVDNSSINATTQTMANANQTMPAANQTMANANQTTANANQTTTTATATTLVPSKLATIQVVFRILQDYKTAYDNLSNPETTELTNNITNAFTPLYRKIFPNFFRMRIRKYSAGSIVADSVLEFDTTNNSISLNVTETIRVFSDAITNGNLSFKIDNSSINVTDITNSAPATTANQTTATATATTLAPSKLATIQVVFRILQDYKTAYDNLTNPETTELTNNITNAFTPFYKRKFLNFFRMRIRKYSAGSIVADSVFEFDTTNNTSSPNVTEVTQVFNDAITNGNLSFKVDNSSINVTDITNSATTQAATTTAGIALFNLTFKMAETFTNDLSNVSTTVAINLTTRIIPQVEKVFKNFKGYKQSVIRRYSNGSIIVDAEIQYDKASSPTAAQLANALAEGVRNGTVALPIDPKTIVVTDVQTGATANKSPVLASVLTAFWMTLASLLLSAVMH